MTTALVPLAEGFEEIEAITIIDVLRRAQVQVTTAGLTGKVVTGSHQIPVTADCLLADVLNQKFDLVVLPGGPGTKNLREDDRLLQLIKDHYTNQGLIGAICAAPTVLSAIGILADKQATVYPSCVTDLQAKEYIDTDVVVDGKVVTGRAPAAAMPFALKLVELLQGADIAQQLAKALVVSA